MSSRILGAFFSFVGPALLCLGYISRRTYVADGREIAACLGLVLLVSAGYSGSCRGELFLSGATAISGALGAGAAWASLQALKKGTGEGLYLLALLAAVVPLQLMLAVKAMELGPALSKAARGLGIETGLAEGMMWLSLAALAAVSGHVLLT